MNTDFHRLLATEPTEGAEKKGLLDRITGCISAGAAL
jgi:hypothetical protein